MRTKSSKKECDFQRQRNPPVVFRSNLHAQGSFYFNKETYQVYKENQNVAIVAQTSSGRMSKKLPFLVQHLLFHGSNWHTLGKCAHRRILIY